ncbi:MAG: hypothetical protein ACD_79C00949G0005 [uncultured bacterium]|nr:MAG: hypothetical protein ACD_79C00949G0005 [uncultured bacterium]
MTSLSPCKRIKFIKNLKKLGFHGPYSGSRHQFMIYNEHRMAIPTNKEYSVPQTKMMLQEVSSILGKKLSADEWEKY